MTLAEAVVELTGRPAEVPGVTRLDLPQFFVGQGYTTGVEVGVFKGRFSEKFCQAGLKMFAVDPWIGFVGQGRGQRRQEQQDEVYAKAVRVLTQPEYDCTIIRKTSMDAVRDFRDRSLDFVYIDGNHIFPYVAQDIYEWERKVRPGGVVAGHDYFNTGVHANNVLCHVKAIVDAYTGLYEIDNWWVFDDPRWQTWMWIKK